MPTVIEWIVLFAGAAAFFSLLPVVVGRLNYADDELSRQNRIENRILNRESRLEYERTPYPRSTGCGFATEPAVLTEDEPKYSFQVNEVLGSENRSRWHILSTTGDHVLADGWINI